MAFVRVYVKKQLRLDLLSAVQWDMYRIGEIGRKSIKARVKRNRDADDRPAKPLKSESWKRIKKAKGLRPIRDLTGTGMQWSKRKKGPLLKFIGHLLDQITTRKVSETTAVITEPTTRMGRAKARRHYEMLLFSPSDRTTVTQTAKQILFKNINKLIKPSTKP